MLYRFGLLACCFVVFESFPAAKAQSPTRDRLAQGAAANLEYRAVFSRAKTPCSQDYSTTGYTTCMTKELALIETHLDAFVEDVRGMTGSAEELSAFNKADAAWRAYRDTFCMVPLRQFEAGTSRDPMSVGCRWNVDRDYMSQLSGFYMLSQFPIQNPPQ